MRNPKEIKFVQLHSGLVGARLTRDERKILSRRDRIFKPFTYFSEQLFKEFSTITSPPVSSIEVHLTNAPTEPRMGKSHHRYPDLIVELKHDVLALEKIEQDETAIFKLIKQSFAKAEPLSPIGIQPAFRTIEKILDKFEQQRFTVFDVVRRKKINERISVAFGANMSPTKTSYDFVVYESKVERSRESLARFDGVVPLHPDTYSPLKVKSGKVSLTQNPFGENSKQFIFDIK